MLLASNALMLTFSLLIYSRYVYTSFFYPWAETSAHHMNKKRSFIMDMSEYFVTGLLKLTLCRSGGINFLYSIQRYSKQFLVHVPPNMSRYIYETKISKELIKPLNCVPYSFIYLCYTWIYFVLWSETRTTVALQFELISILTHPLQECGLW